MYKKIITLLFVLSWCFTLSAQDFMEVSPNLTSTNHDPSKEAIWDLLLGFDVTALSGAAGNAGAEWDGTYLYSARWGSNLIHKYNATGTTLVEEFSIPGVSGLRDLAFDGTYMYGGAAANTIYQMDFVSKTLIGTIPSPVAVRWIAYDEANDGFWVGTWGDPLTLISRTGTVLQTIATTLTSKYGAAYDNVSPGGPYLWIFDQGAGAGTPQLIHQYNIASGTATGVTHDVTLEFPTAAGIAGGLFSMSDFATGLFTLGGLMQGTPDNMFVYEIAPAGGGGAEFFDDFESYTAGIQLCLQTTNWEPWVGSIPGSSADPFVSNVHSYSGLNSVVIVSGNDLVRRHGPKTSGKWYISFLFYIPAGKSGYFNTMSGYDPGTNVWGMDSYFNVGGIGNIDTTGGGSSSSGVAFNWAIAQWNQVVVVVDLDATPPRAEYWLGTGPSNFTQIATWGWTQGGTKPNELHVNDLYGAAATDEMYVDDFYFGDTMPAIIPVELTSFVANVNNLGQVLLNWSTATELNNQGFEIERRTESSEFRTIAFVEGYGTTTETRNYSYTDKFAENGINFYRLKQIDYNGTYSYSDVVEVDVTGPLSFDLAQNYPNPFNPSTSIKYSVPESGNIRLSVFNIVGEEVAVLANGFSQAGSFEVTFDASNLSTGVYLYKLQSANSVQTKKMMLLK